MARRLRALRVAPVAGGAWVVAYVSTVAPQAAAPLALSLWAAALLAVAALLRIRGPRARILTLIVVVAFAAAAAAASHVALAEPARAAARELGLSGGRAIAVHATVTGKVERRATGELAFDAVADRITIGPSIHPVAIDVSVLAAPEAVEGVARLDAGAVIVADGTARAAGPGRRAVLVVSASRGLTVLRPPGGPMAVTSDLRKGLVRAVQGLPDPGAGLVPGLAVGETSAVTAALDTDMKSSSLSHLTAVSGANCAIVVGLAFAAAGALGARRGVRVVIGALTLAGFVLLVTPEPSVVRAAAMAAIAMLAVQLGRTVAGVAVLCLSVAVLLVADPWLAGSLGFALSVAATMSLLLFARPLAAGLERRMPRALALALSVPLAAQLACGPLLVLITPTVPLYGILATLVAEPAAPIATVVGLAACLAVPFPWLQSGLSALAWLPAAWIAATATTVAHLAGNTVPWLEGWPGVFALAALGVAVGAVVVGVRASAGRRRVVMHGIAAAIVCAVVGAGIGGGALATIAGPLTTPADWSIAACDVGQGDGLMVRSHSSVAVIDTGPSPEPMEACLAKLGIGRVDLLVLTHFDLDHAGGARALRGRVDLVLHGPPGDAGDERLLADLAGGGARMELASAGMTGNLGTAQWSVLWPRARSRAFPPGNDAGVVLDVRGGEVPTALFLADLSASAQRAVVASGALRPPYAVVKVAHHGSADQDPALYALTGGAVALISVGAHNDYGHPRETTLTMLASFRFTVARTDLSGLVLLQRTEAGVSVWRERAPPAVGAAR